MEIQWYPGHMAKTKRLITESLKRVDAVCEIVDARIPEASRNPDVDQLAGGKPRLMLLNRADQADPEQNALWARYYRSKGFATLETDAKTGAGVAAFPAALRALLAEKIRRYEEKGMTGRTLKVMIVGIPNVGKSSFINKVLGRRSAKAEDRPGVTRVNQWFFVDSGIELLDTPGILPPKMKNRRAGLLLAYTGAVKDTILDLETLACGLMSELARVAPSALTSRYGVEIPSYEDFEGPPEGDKEVAYGYELLLAAAGKRGFLIAGGERDTERMARVLLDEFREGKLGRITLETPPAVE